MFIDLPRLERFKAPLRAECEADISLLKELLSQLDGEVL